MILPARQPPAAKKEAATPPPANAAASPGREKITGAITGRAGD